LWCSRWCAHNFSTSLEVKVSKNSISWYMLLGEVKTWNFGAYFSFGRELTKLLPCQKFSSHVESLLKMFLATFESLVICSLSFLVLVSKYLRYRMRSMLVLLYAPWNWFWPNFEELSVQDTLKYPSHHLKYLVLKRKSIFMTKISLAES